MRNVLRKLYRHQVLADEEYALLMDYAAQLRAHSPASYELFYERFAPLLHREYQVHLPRFHYGIDDVYDYLLAHPELTEVLGTGPVALDMFPPHLRDYLVSDAGEVDLFATVLPAMQYIQSGQPSEGELPRPRLTQLVVKFESGNPLKESGLKAHFDRLAAYPFVSRLQSVRYLRGRKASQERIEVVTDDCLGGIFTNKEKSIYYYIFLTEKQRHKAENACRLLNKVFYGFSSEDLT